MSNTNTKHISQRRGRPRRLDMERVLTLRQDGMTVREIADAVGSVPSAISTAIRRELAHRGMRLVRVRRYELRPILAPISGGGGVTQASEDDGGAA